LYVGIMVQEQQNGEIRFCVLSLETRHEDRDPILSLALELRTVSSASFDKMSTYAQG